MFPAGFKQLGLGMLMYSQDYDEMLCPIALGNPTYFNIAQAAPLNAWDWQTNYGYWYERRVTCTQERCGERGPDQMCHDPSCPRIGQSNCCRLY